MPLFARFLLLLCAFYRFFRNNEVEKWIRSLGTDKPLPPPTR